MRQPWRVERAARITTDASLVGLGAVLEQEEEETHKWVTIAFWSRKLLPRETRYHATDREWLACVEAVAKVWRHYVAGRPFLLRSDHAALGPLLRSTQLDLNPRQLRWVERMQTFQFTFQHVAGTSNRVADALSRTPSYYANAIEIVPYPTTFSLGEIQAAAKQDAGYAAAVNEAKGRGDVQWEDQECREEVGLLRTKGGKLCLPNDVGLKEKLLSEAHETWMAGHLGREMLCLRASPTTLSASAQFGQEAPSPFPRAKGRGGLPTGLKAKG